MSKCVRDTGALVLGLALAGCTPAATSAAGRDSSLPQPAVLPLAGMANVTFPGGARVSTSDTIVGRSKARVVTATYVEPAAYLPFHYHETPLLMEAQVIAFDRAVRTSGEASQAFGHELWPDLAEAGEVVSGTAAEVAGVPGYAFEVDVPVSGPVWKRRQRTARVSLRIAIGPTSVSMFLTAFWRDALLEDDVRRLELDDFLRSAHVEDHGRGTSSFAEASIADLARAVTGVLGGLS
jgi:hypothetical protein